MIVLAIESTLDETGCAVARLNDGLAEIVSDIKASSAEIHAKYGGVIPEIAAREQITAIVPVIETAIQQAATSKHLSIRDIDAIAVTEGPGMIGCLLIGVETAKTLALAWKKPLIRVNHMAAHVFANWIRSSTGSDAETRRHGDTPELPAVALIVSGGHTDIMFLKSLTEWGWLGGTRDDAAGEAFDKAARAMGFPYPGGPQIQVLSDKAEGESTFKLPRPMIHEDNLEMSFSGLKTAVIEVIKQKEKGLSEEETAMLAREFNQAVVDVLVKKTMMAVEEYKPKSVLLAGGVAANSLLRQELAEKLNPPAGGQKTQKIKFFVPDLKYCTDNAAMIAACALMRPEYVDPLKLKPNPGLEIE